MDACNFLTTLPFLLRVDHLKFAEVFEKDFVFKNVLDNALCSFEIHNSVVHLSTYSKEESEGLSDASYSSSVNSPSLLSTALKLNVYIGINADLNSNEIAKNQQHMNKKVPGLFFQIESNWYAVNHLSIETISCPKSSITIHEFKNDTVQNNENMLKSESDRRNIPSVLLSWTTINTNYPSISMRWWIPVPSPVKSKNEVSSSSSAVKPLTPSSMNIETTSRTNNSNTDPASITLQHRQSLTQAVSIINQMMQPTLPAYLISSSTSSSTLSRWPCLSQRELIANSVESAQLQQHPSALPYPLSSSSSIHTYQNDASVSDTVNAPACIQDYRVKNQFSASTKLLKLLNQLLITNKTFEEISSTTTEELTKNFLSRKHINSGNDDSSVSGGYNNNNVNIVNKNAFMFDISSKIYNDILRSFHCDSNGLDKNNQPSSSSSSSSSSGSGPTPPLPSNIQGGQPFITTNSSHNKKRSRPHESMSCNHSSIPSAPPPPPLITSSSSSSSLHKDYNDIFTEYRQSVLSATDQQRLECHYHTSLTSAENKIRRHLDDYYDTGIVMTAVGANNDTLSSAVTSPYNSIKQLKEAKAQETYLKIQDDMAAVHVSAANLMAAISLINSSDIFL